MKLRWWSGPSEGLESLAWINPHCWKHSPPHSKPSECRSSKVESWRSVNPCAATSTHNNFIFYSAYFQLNLLTSLCGGQCAPWRNSRSAGSYVLLCVILPLLQRGFWWTRCQNVAQTCLLNSGVPVPSAHTLLLLLRSQLSSLFLRGLKTDYCWCRRNYLSSSVLGGDRTCGGQLELTLLSVGEEKV